MKLSRLGLLLLLPSLHPPIVAAQECPLECPADPTVTSSGTNPPGVSFQFSVDPPDSGDAKDDDGVCKGCTPCKMAGVMLFDSNRTDSYAKVNLNGSTSGPLSFYAREGLLIAGCNKSFFVEVQIFSPAATWSAPSVGR